MAWLYTRELLVILLVLMAGCGDSESPRPSAALVVVSPHPDDESILAAATINRRAADPAWSIRAVYLSSGDRATLPGDCGGIPEARKRQQIVELREQETRAAWAVLAPGRDVPLKFLRGPDQGLVASSSFANGIHQDELTPAGAEVLEQAVAWATGVLPSVREVLLVTTAIYDAHPDHRVAYRAARAAAEQLARDPGVRVRLWSWIVHDEGPVPTVSICCPGDFHWPAAGPNHDYLALTDAPERPGPPLWDRLEEVGELGFVRRDSLSRHVSQVAGYPALCMPVPIPDYYVRWQEKVEEPFYEEAF